MEDFQLSVSCKSRLSRCCFGLPPFCWWQNGRVSCWSICQAEGQKIVRSDKFVSSNNFKTREGESSSRGKNIVNSKIDLIWIFRYPKFKLHFKKISIKFLYFFRIFLEYFRIFLDLFLTRAREFPGISRKIHFPFVPGNFFSFPGIFGKFFLLFFLWNSCFRLLLLLLLRNVVRVRMLSAAVYCLAGHCSARLLLLLQKFLSFTLFWWNNFVNKFCMKQKCKNGLWRDHWFKIWRVEVL